MTFPQAYVRGVRIPFHATRFVRAANGGAGLSTRAPVDVLSSFHADGDTRD